MTKKKLYPHGGYRQKILNQTSFFYKIYLYLRKNLKIPFNKRNSYFLNKKIGSSGQGIVEYILILSLSTIMILGFIYQLNKAFSAWAESYFGDYLACLIETGELPSLGAPSRGNNNQASAGCNSQYQAFSLSNGRPLIKGAGFSHSNNTRNRNRRNQNSKTETNSSSDESKDQTGNKNSSSKANKNSSSTAANEQTGNASNSDPLSEFSSETSGASGRGNRLSRRKRIISKKGRSKGSEAESSDDGLKTLKVNPSTNLNRNEAIPLSDSDFSFFIDPGNRKERKEKEKKKEVKVSTKKEKALDRKAFKRKEKILITQTKRTVDVESEIEPLTFGNFFRYLIIAGIVIALFVVIGGQLVQIKESLK